MKKTEKKAALVILKCPLARRWNAAAPREKTLQCAAYQMNNRKTNVRYVVLNLPMDPTAAKRSSHISKCVRQPSVAEGGKDKGAMN